MFGGDRRARRRAILITAAVALCGAWQGPNLTTANAGGWDRATACGDSWGAAERLDNLSGGLLEVSGFVSSARYAGVAWMITDSDTPSSLYSFTLDGNTPRWREFDVAGVKNIDWEDITYSIGPDGRGRLWILENGMETGPKKLYEVIEPDPFEPRTLAVEATYRVEYPGANLNTEAIFAMGDRLAFVSKTNPNRVFRIPGAVSTSAVNDLDEAQNLDADHFLTATGTSADGSLLMALSTNDTVSIFQNSEAGTIGGFLNQRPITREHVPNLQFEAGDFFPYASCSIVLVSEDSSVWRLSNSGTLTAQQLPAPAPTPDTVPPAPDAPAGPTPAPPVQAGGNGYWLLDRRGSVHSFGDARHFGDPAATPGAPATDVEPTPANDGYWVLDETGWVGAYGAAPDLGSAPIGSLAPTERATSLSATATGGGYWVFTSRGRVLPFGDAEFLGDMREHNLNQPVLDSVATRSGHGYYMVAADGGVFTFGDATFLGSMGHVRLNAPVRSLVPDPDGSGYWLVASDGGVFAFAAPFRGSMGGAPLNRPVSGMAPYGDGYVMVGEDGGVFNFSNLAFSGSLGADAGERNITAVAPLR